MEIRGKVEITIEDLEYGAVFVFCDENVLMLKGGDDVDCLYAIRLSDGEVFNVWENHWQDRPVRQIKTVLTIE